jgi:DEAD/DEAH box helicase domain-containing protein
VPFTNGKMAMTYQCISLNLTSKQAILKQVPNSPFFTAAFTQTETSSLKALTNSVALPLRFSSENDNADSSTVLTLELSYGQVSHITSGYSLMTQLYEQTCLN